MAKILLIDDDAHLRRFLQTALEQHNHQVACLERAEGGVDVLATGEFDLVLVDEHMPGMSGSEFLSVLRQRALNIPTILMTGYAKGDILQTAKKLEAFVVSKPSGGHDEFWKELEPLLADALQGEAEVLTALRRAIEAALKTGKTNLAPRLRKLLDQELLARALTVANGNQEEAVRHRRRAPGPTGERGTVSTRLQVQGHRPQFSCGSSHSHSQPPRLDGHPNRSAVGLFQGQTVPRCHHQSGSQGPKRSGLPPGGRFQRRRGRGGRLRLKRGFAVAHFFRRDVF